MPRALILSWHFYPSREVGAKRVSELARRLRDAGWELTVMAAPLDVVPELEERIRGMEVIRVAPPAKLYPRVARLVRGRRDAQRPQTGQSAGPSPGADSGGRSWRWHLLRHCNALEWTLDDKKLWSARLVWRALRLRRKWDWIISSGPPVSVHMAARTLAAMTGARWLMDLRDPWIGNGFWPKHVQSGPRDLIEHRAEASCVGRADLITVASPGIAAALVRRRPQVGERLQVVLNGYDGSAAPVAHASGRLRLLYAGTLYFNRDPFPLLEALRDLVRLPGVDRNRIEFTLVGNCRHWNGRSLDAWVGAEGLQDCIRILDPVPPARVAELMRDSEVLVNFAQGQPEQIPAKLYDYMASGRETLLIAEADSDAARITRESGVGRIVEPQDRRGLRAVLRELYAFYVEDGHAFRPAAAVVESYSRARQNSRFLELLALTTARS